MMLKTFRWLAATACLLIAAAAMAETQRPPLEEMPQQFQLAFWFNQAALAYNEGDIADWAEATEKLHALRPYNQDFMTHLVEAYAQLGETSKAFNMMLIMQQQGLAHDWDSVESVDDLRRHRLYEHLNNLMSEAGQPFGHAEVFSTLAGRNAMPEAMAHDPASGRLFVGTVREGHILYTTDGEQWQEFATPESNDELMAVFDLAVDSQRGHLWVATGAVPQHRRARPADHGRTALLKLDLESGELISVHRVIPDGNARLLGSIAVAGDGTVYAADARKPSLFRLIPGERHPQQFFVHQNFSSLRGIALSDDDQLLYVADYDLGILVVGTGDTRQAWKLAVPETLNVGGIDGLYVWQGHLVAIQNGINPNRILRLKLGPDGLGVVAVAPVVAALDQFDVPTFGALAGDELYFLAASHWQRVDSRGRPTGGNLPAVPIMRTNLEAPEVMVVGQEVLEQLQRAASEEDSRQ
jgi:sugar lactone lactonase YvrE